MKTSTRGFTLIELLVVIALIALLAAIIAANLNFARNKGNDAAIKSDLNAIRQEAEIYRTNNNNLYDSIDAGDLLQGVACKNAINPGTLFSDTTVENALSAIGSINNSSLDCAVSPTTYSFAAQLTVYPNTIWCIDSSGYSSNVSKAFGVPYSSLSGTCTTGGACAAHPTGNVTACQ